MAQLPIRPYLTLPLRWVLAVPLAIQVGLVGLVCFDLTLWSEESHQAQIPILWLVFIGLFLGVGLGGWLLICRCLQRTLNLLTQRITEIQKGHFSHETLRTHFPELDQLADAITQMSLTLQDNFCERETALNLALAAGEMGLWQRDLSTDSEGQYWSPEVYRQLGIDPEQIPQPSRQMFLSCVHPDDRHLLGEIDWNEAEGSVAFKQEFRIVRPNGEVCWLNSFWQTISLQGKVVKICGINKDITQERQQKAERQATMKSLQVSETRLKALIDNLPFRVWARDPEGRLILQNPTDIADFGNRLGTTVKDLNLDDDTYQKWQQLLVDLQSGQTVYHRYPETVRGETRHFFSIVAPVQESISGLGVIGINIDITDQTKAEEALRVSESRFRALVDHLPFRVWARDPEGRLIFQNPVDLAAFGNKLGTRIEEWTLPPEMYAKWKAREDSLKAGQPITTRSRQTVQGESRYFLSIDVPLEETTSGIGWLGISIDINDQVMAEKALKTSEAKFRALVESLPFQIWARDREGRLIFQSQSDQMRFGNCLGQRIEEMGLSAEEISDWQATVARIMSGEMVRSEKEVYRDGEKSLLFIGAPILQEEEVFGSLGVLIDITEQRRTETNLLRTQAQLKLAFQAGKMGAWEIDLIRNKQWWSPENYRLLGFQHDELRDILDVQEQVIQLSPDAELIYRSLPPELLCNCGPNIQKAIETGHFADIEFSYSPPDGKQTWVLIRAALSFDASGTPKKLIGISMDITERKLAEQKASQLASIVCSSIDAIISADMDGIILSWNGGAERTYGYPAHQVLGSSLLNILPGKIEDYLSTEDPFISQHRRQDGQLIDVFISASILYDSQGDPCGTSWIIRDISYQQEVERLKSEFVSIVSHELRTPLTSIHGSLATLNTGILGSLQPKGQELLQIAEQNTTRLIRLINDILNLERLENPTVSVDLQSCRCADLIGQACAVMQSLADEAQIQIQQILLDGTIWADPDMMLQLLTNLLSNAIKFSPPQSCIQISTQPRDADFLITVRDQGSGIPADKLELIFERFQQVDASDSRKKGGTGLGLAICRQIVERHQGQIWAESLSGQGTTIFVTLPYAQE